MAIKHKLIMLVMATCMASLFLVGTAFVVWEYRSIRRDIARDLGIQAEMTADNCKAALAFDDATDARETLKTLKAESSILLACIYSDTAELFATYYRDGDETAPLPSVLGVDSHEFSDEYLTVFRPIVLDGETIGTVCLRSDLNPMHESLRRNAQKIFAVLLLASIAAYVLSSKLQNIISRPILSLAEVAKAVSEKSDYATRATKQSNDEVGLLIDSFNEMLEQIQQRDSELVKAKEQLEARVQGRTAELTSANDKLTAEIAEREKAESRQADLLRELETVNQELKDFAYIASHDLKAPLRAIKTLSEWITQDYADKLDEEGKEQLRLLGTRVERMHNLIDGILQYSRVGRVKEKLAQVDLSALVPEIVDMVAPPQNIEVTIEDNLPTIIVEETRIMQVFQNLLSNAVKYMDKPEGLIRIGCAVEDGFYRFSVSDNGPGIEQRHFERIFKIFQTLSSRDEFESTGVGLTVVKKIVELYGGKIWLESKVGEGTTFFFTFPVAGPQDYPLEDGGAETETVCSNAAGDGGNNDKGKAQRVKRQ
jgi:signal transduction histidine kinase